MKINPEPFQPFPSSCLKCLGAGNLRTLTGTGIKDVVCPFCKGTGKKENRKFRVRGICLVPTELEIEIEAPNAETAKRLALRSDWKSHISTNDGDARAAYDWEPTAEEIL